MSDKPPAPSQKQPLSAALRLISRRGEGLVKIISPIPRPGDEDYLNKFEGEWNFHLRQINNPAEVRPPRRTFPNPEYAWNPLEQKETTPAALLASSHESTTMTSTTLLPRDARMELFGTANTAGCGILYDLRLCDLLDEKFVFTKDAFTDADWFFNPHASHLRDTFKSRPINDLRIDTNMENNVSHLREYNEILAGLNAKAISAILLQPPTKAKESTEQQFMSRMYAIARKLDLAQNNNRHLPIVIFDANNGSSEYTFTQQQADMKNYLLGHPFDRSIQNLFDENATLYNFKEVESESNQKPQITSPDIDVIKARRKLIIKKIHLVDEMADLLQAFNALKDRFSTQTNIPQNVFNDQQNVLVELMMVNSENLAKVEKQLKTAAVKLSDTHESKHLMQFQEDAATAKLNAIDDSVRRYRGKAVNVSPQSPSFWQRYQNEIIGAVAGILIVSAIAAVSVFSFGILPAVGIVALAGLACLGVGVGAALGALGGRIFKFASLPAIKSNLEHPLMDDNNLQNPASARSTVKRRVVSLNSEPEETKRFTPAPFFSANPSAPTPTAAPVSNKSSIKNRNR
jgi:hypothetical protein